MQIATWNINSVRLRLPSIKRFLEHTGVDVLCLQEIKVANELFPSQFFKDIGYEYIEFHGQKSYNGVAIISRIPLMELDRYHFVHDKEDSRHIRAVIGDIELHNFYIPAGGDIPDVTINPKFEHKLRYIDGVVAWFKENRSKQDKMVLLGDLNIAPLEHDVWSHKQLLKEVSHSPIEIEKMLKWQQSLEWCDIHRQFTSPEHKLYSWWSYRGLDWQKSDRGRRLDHIWLTPALADKAKKAWIMKETRGWDLPSDHVPVIVELKI